MNNLSIMREAAALGGYTIDATSGQDVINKQRALRRVNMIKADVISRFAGKWSPNYREGWLALAPIYNTGTVTLVQNSNTVTGAGTTWTSDMKGRKFQGADSAYYKIASVPSATSLLLTTPYQGTSISSQTYQIWKDEYRLYPEAMSIGGFVDYYLPRRATEAWPSNMKDSFPFPTTSNEPTIYTVLNSHGRTDAVTVGTVSGSQNSSTLTGLGTSWLTGTNPIEPGWEIIIGTNTYHVRRVNSDTELELYQLLTVAVASSTYTAIGKNSKVIRFESPTLQRIVNYWYYSKDYPFVNDNDEDWIAEQFPRVLVNGVSYFDYIDKNDVARGFNSQQVYENSIKDMKVAMENAYTGIRTLGIYIPPEARD